MQIRKKIVSGIRPTDVLEKPETYTIRKFEDDCVLMQEREASNGGKFEQYTLYLKKEEDEKMVQYLFEKDLSPLAQAWGEDTTQWEGNEVKISAETEGKYLRLILSPASEQISL